jgi:O-succinylbenzoate synthase
MLKRATLLVNQGYRSIKLKLGQRVLEDDIALTYRVHARLDDKATLRLDANRSWTYAQAIAFGKAIGSLPIEYIEEPLQDASRLAELAGEWSLPIALDETLIAQDAGDIQPFENLKAMVLKPTLLGGFGRTLEYVKRAHDLSLKTVVSSCFESAIGLNLLAHFASQIAPDTPCGLDTSEWFKENLLDLPLTVSSGQMLLNPSRTLTTDINLSLLTEVERG